MHVLLAPAAGIESCYFRILRIHLVAGDKSCTWVSMRWLFQNRSPLRIPSQNSSKYSKKHSGKLALVQISPQLAETLFNKGYAVYQIGVETELNIQSYS